MAISDEITKQTGRRDALRKRVQDALNEIQNALRQDPPDEEVLLDQCAQIIAREKKLTQLNQIIFDLLTDTVELDEEIEEVEKWTADITLWKDRARRRVDRLEKDRYHGVSGNRGQSSSPSPSLPSTINHLPASVKLPQLQIRKFGGDVEQWFPFWGQFESAIHKNSNITNIDKFNYLKSYLEGQAEKSIEGISMSEDNYELAVSILRKRFGRKELILSNRLNNFLKLVAVPKSDDLIGLRKLYDAAQIEVRSLESLGMMTKDSGELFAHMLGGLLPRDIIENFCRENERQDRANVDEVDAWKIDELLEYFRKEIEIKERSFSVTRSGATPKQTNNSFTVQYEKNSRINNGNGSWGKPSAAVLNTAVESNRRGCLFCEGNHAYFTCNQKNVVERKGIALKKRLCFLCLAPGHPAQDCTGRIQNCRICGRSHHQILCSSQNQIRNTVPKSVFYPEGNRRVSKENEVVTCHVATPNINCNEILLQTAQALIIGASGEIGRARCLLDGGSHRSFVKEELSRRLKLEQIGEETLRIHPFGREHPIVAVRKKVKLVLKNVRNNEQVELEALETPEISGAVLSIPGGAVGEEMHKLGLQLADEQESGKKGVPKTIDILIGADYFWKVAKATPIRRLGESLVAIDTKLGWTLQGPTNMSGSSVGVNSVAVFKVAVESYDENERLSEKVNSFWELEHLGIVGKDEGETSKENNALLNFNETIEFKNGRYSVSLPWKENVKKLGDNYGETKRRTINLLKKLKSEPNRFLEYNTIIEDQLQSGILERVTLDNGELLGVPLYYMPHRGVFRNESLTTKTRVVYDASSRTKNAPSLNECLESGPCLLPELFGILLRFRTNRIAVSGDVEKAFHQISVTESDRDALRFLWVAGVDSPDNERLVTLRFTRVPFGVTASPFLLAAAIKHHVEKFKNEHPRAYESLAEDLYVDDLISGAESVEMADLLIQQCSRIMAEGSMNLRKWRSNSEFIRSKWGHVTTNEQSLTNPGPLKVLGLMWDEFRDVLMFEVKPLLEFLIDKRDTKRWVLKAVARIFDPLGFLTPFTIVAKVIIQDIWQQGSCNKSKTNKLGWDEPLSEIIRQRFNNWCEQLPNLSQIEVPRYYFHNDLKVQPMSVEIHGFVDASVRAFACVIYLRNVYENGSIETVLVASKARVAPIGLKTLTLPRLELMGALLGARLLTSLLTTLKMKIEKIVMWGDSEITLHWIYGNAERWKPFVKNRVLEIQSLTDKACWNHCPGKLNPADIATRGLTLANLASNEIWWHGPRFLKEVNPVQKKYEPTEKVPPQIEEELRVTVVFSLAETYEPLLDLEKFSKLKTVLRVTAWIKRFVYNIKHKDQRRSGPLTTVELNKAERLWITSAQSEFYGEERRRLENKQPINRGSKILSLNPQLDNEGLIRIGGRIDAAKVSYEERHPCILPSHHRITYLIGMSIHVRLQHAGVNNMLVELRERFWVPKGRQLMKKVVGSCPRCKIFNAKPTTAVMAPLPDIRINPAPPFEICGIDHAGPLYTKDNSKCYVALYTCAVTRAVHLELVSSLSTESFLMSFRRFIARRGIARVVLSDNAATFKRADADLQILLEHMRNPEILDYFGSLKITWSYIAERGAWWGGFWERLVRSVKVALRRVLAQAHLEYEELETLLIEIEATINSRPMTFIYENPKEPSPLTPAHFLVGKRLTALPSQIYSTSELPRIEKRDLINRLKKRQALLDRFWSRWKTDYLLELRSAHHTIVNGRPTKSLELGDVVLIEDCKQPRAMWKMAVVTDLRKGRDGVVRSCLVRLPNGNHLRRPVQLLYNLEFN